MWNKPLQRIAEACNAQDVDGAAKIFHETTESFLNKKAELQGDKRKHSTGRGGTTKLVEKRILGTQRTRNPELGEVNEKQNALLKVERQLREIVASLKREAGTPNHPHVAALRTQLLADSASPAAAASRAAARSGADDC